ncbi:MAG: hypothetical protein ABW252_00940 [Polyangiales bacterium]
METVGVPSFAFDQRIGGLPGGFWLPTRMSVLPLARGGLALVSPIPIDDAAAAQLAALGEVRYLIAPSLLHHGYVEAARARYPAAKVLAPPGLARKRPSLRVDHVLDGTLPSDLTDHVEVVRVAGAPAADEYVFFHRATETLVVTDLVFNVKAPQGFWANVLLFVGGCHGRLGSSREWRLLVRDKAEARRSIARIVALPTRTLVVSHGDIVTDGAQDGLREALHWLLR